MIAWVGNIETGVAAREVSVSVCDVDLVAVTFGCLCFQGVGTWCFGGV